MVIANAIRGPSGKWAAILFLAFLLRLGWALIVPVEPISDSSMYDTFAREIAAGRGYRFPDDNLTVYWPVGPAALYGLLYIIFGPSGWIVAAINIVMGTATVGLIGVLGSRTFGERTGLLAGLFSAIWPLWIQFSTVLSSELPFVLLICGALVVYGTPRIPNVIRVPAYTALLVAAAFMRPTAIPLILILPTLRIIYTRSIKQTVLELILAVVVAGTLFTPWALRNQAIFGSPVLVSANFGANLWMGNNPDSIGGYMPLPDKKFRNEVVRDEYFKDKALSFIQDNPKQYIMLCIQRMQHSFSRETIGVAWNKLDFSPLTVTIIKAGSSGYWLLVFALAIAGAIRFVWGNPIRIFEPMILISGLFTAVAVLVVGQDRYHMPLMPFVAIFAAYFINTCIFRSKRIEYTGYS